MPTINMTAQWAERVKVSPEEARVDFLDTKVTGLGLRVSSAGKKVWFVFYRVKGQTKKKRLTLLPYPLLSLADAREKAHEVILDAANGLDPAQAKQEHLKAPTFERFAEEYIERYAKPKKRSWRKDQDAIKRDLLPVWGERKAHDIKRRDVVLLLDAIADRGSPIQANRTLALIRKMFNWGISRDIIETTPCIQVKPPMPEKSRERVLSEDEIRAVWRAFEQLDPIFEASFKIRLLTAQRGGEVDKMRWADLDFDGGWWTIPAEMSKNKLSHRVPLSKPVVAIIESLIGHSGGKEWVFLSRKGMPIRNPQHAADRVVAISGVKDFTLHDLRRTASTYMTRQLKVSRFNLRRVLNHKDTGVTSVYDRNEYDDEKRAALDGWGDRLFEILRG